MRSLTVAASLALAACSGDLGAGPVRPDVGREPRLDATGAFECTDGGDRAPPARLWRLSNPQYAQTAGALLGLADPQAAVDLSPGGAGAVFRDEDDALWVRDDELAGYRRSARALAEAAVREGTLAERWPCLVDGTEGCAARFVAELGREAFRRPLTAEERQRYEALYALGEDELGAGPATVVEAMLQSPHLLYRSERGPEQADGRVALTEHELAAALSYYFLDGPPDAELAQLADEGRLGEALDAQVARLAQDPRWLAQRQRFVRELLELSHVAELEKEPGAFPRFDVLRPRFDDGLDRFVGRVLGSEAPTLGALFDSREAWVDEELADFYGVQAPADGWVTLPESRRGVFTRGAFLAATSGPARASPVTRGLVLRTRVLCDEVDPPPDGVNTSLPPAAEGVSERELVELATSTGGCADCHSQINDLGFAFGRYDAVGQLRDVDAYGQAIDVAGTLSGTDGIDGPFADLDGLLDTLRDSEQVSRCMTLQAFRYGAGRPAAPSDACALTEMMDAAGQGAELDLVALLERYPRTDAFRFREVTQ